MLKSNLTKAHIAASIALKPLALECDDGYGNRTVVAYGTQAELDDLVSVANPLLNPQVVANPLYRM